MASDLCFYQGKIVARIIEGKAYKRDTRDLPEPTKALEAICKFFLVKGVSHATKLSADQFEKLDDGNDRLANKMFGTFDGKTMMVFKVPDAGEVNDG
jgi:hypothetical protein